MSYSLWGAHGGPAMPGGATDQHLIRGVSHDTGFRAADPVYGSGPLHRQPDYGVRDPYAAHDPARHLTRPASSTWGYRGGRQEYGEDDFEDDFEDDEYGADFEDDDPMDAPEPRRGVRASAGPVEYSGSEVGLAILAAALLGGMYIGNVRVDFPKVKRGR